MESSIAVFLLRLGTVPASCSHQCLCLRRANFQGKLSRQLANQLGRRQWGLMREWSHSAPQQL